jgi:hypothetical protein
MKITVNPCSLVDCYEHLGGRYCLRLRGRNECTLVDYY